MRLPSRSRHSHSARPRPRSISPRKHPQQARSQATVDAIIDAAAQVLVKHGYDKANTGLIARAAGVSVGSLYQYFPNKDAVFSELLRRALDRIFAQTLAGLAAVESGTFSEKVRGCVRALLAAKAENPKLYRVLKTELGRLEGKSAVRKMAARSVALTEALLAAHPEALGSGDPSRIAFLIVSAIDGIMDALLLEDPAMLSDPALPDEMTAMVLASTRALGKLGPPRARERATAGPAFRHVRSMSHSQP